MLILAEILIGALLLLLAFVGGMWVNECTRKQDISMFAKHLIDIHESQNQTIVLTVEYSKVLVEISNNLTVLNNTFNILIEKATTNG